MSSSGVAKADEIICHGVRIPYRPEIITPRIERAMRNGRYEGGEARRLAEMIRPGDRVLELGGGVGLLAVVAARVAGPEAVTVVEANPGLLPIIEEVLSLNGMTGARVLNAIVSPHRETRATFYLRPDFWASSFEPASRPFVGTRELSAVTLADLIAEHRPTVISCDIEGAERGLFADVDLSGVRALIIEVHPKVYGDDGVAETLAPLARAGFRATNAGERTTVRIFERDERPASASAADPKVLVATCMKDEGPFILEWLAWHKSIGVTDFVVFTNDCTDGTDALLDRLDHMDELTHLPNPALAAGRSNFQPLALR